MSYANSIGRRPAFTLIELLVSLGILALIIGILLPAVGRARKQAQTASCLSNQRQLTLGCSQFAQDNNGHLPFTGWGTNTAQNWLYDPMMVGPQFVQSDVQNSQLWKYVRSEKLFRCPGDAGPWLPKRSNQMSSYVMNGSMSSFGPNGNEGLEILQFRSDAIIFWEIPADLGVAGTANDATNSPDEGATARHNHGTTVGYIDGHAEVMSQQEYTAECAKGPSKLWCDPTDPTGGRGSHTSPPIFQE